MEDKDVVQLVMQHESRIKLMEDMLANVQDIAMSVKELSTEIKYMRVALNKNEEKIEELEKAPADKWNKLIATIISGVGGAVVGLILGGNIL